MFCSHYILYSAGTDNDSPNDSHANLFSSFLGLARSFIAFSTSKSFVVRTEVINIDSLYLDDDWVQVYKVGLHLSYMGNKVDVILEPFVVGKKACIWQPCRVWGNYYGFCIMFTMFQHNNLKAMNIAPS